MLLQVAVIDQVAGIDEELRIADMGARFAERIPPRLEILLARRLGIRSDDEAVWLMVRRIGRERTGLAPFLAVADAETVLRPRLQAVGDRLVADKLRLIAGLPVAL
ncbi:hypothetical protein D1872_245650 [compost metagenome]